MPQQEKPALFISYRRGDSPDSVKLIYERLKERLSRWDIFYDHASIPLGEQFPEMLRTKVAAADVVLVIIGPKWLDILRERRTAPVDHVRAEIGHALAAGASVVPILVGGAVMPTEADLVDFAELLPFLKRNGRPVRPDPDFDADIEPIITHLKQFDSAEAVGAILADKYTLTAEIGHGGMGVVYAAQQKQPIKRTVAVKLIKPGMDSRDVLARFDAERQALAVMDHPNIAKVLDAGIADSGRPFFVMEYVKGVPITEYCDDEKLTTQERLNLFIPVCNAVQHAHQKGIIHRDLKPSNVLVEVVDGKPVPKIIDFGLAKALGHQLTDKTLHTALDMRVGTLEYSAPEQAAGRSFDIDTRSDIYSLGVMLYELLTGAPPFTHEELLKIGEDEMRRVIREVEPVKPSKRLKNSGALPAIAEKRHIEPSKLPRLIRGDLDWIVMKCLEKEQARRYESANQLGQELQHFLAVEPVQAGPPSLRYRVKKFLWRNKGPVFATSAVVLTLILGVVGIGIALRLAEENDAKARRATDSERQALAVEVNTELTRAFSLRDRAKSVPLNSAEKRKESSDIWDAVLATVTKADNVLAAGRADVQWRQTVDQRLADLRAEAAEVARDRAMAESLDAARELRGEITDQDYDRTRRPSVIVFGHGGIAAYADAFRAYGVDVLTLPAAEAGRKLKESQRIAVQLTDALDDWLALEVGGPVVQQLLKVAEAADPDPFRNRLRAAVAAMDGAALLDLAHAASSLQLSGPTILLMADGLQMAGKLDEAVALLRHAREQHPDDFWVNDILGVYLQASDPACVDEASRCFSAAAALRPGSHFVWTNLGMAFAFQWRFPEANQAYEKSIEKASERKSDFLMPRIGLAQLYYQRRGAGDVDKATALLEDVLGRNPTSGQARCLLAQCLAAKGAGGKAVDVARAFQKQEPKSGTHLYWLGETLYYAGLKEDAVTVFKRALELNDNSAEVHLGIFWAQATKATPDFEQAEMALELAKKTNAKSLSILWAQSFLLERQGKMDQAIDVLRQVAALQPRNWNNHIQLGDLLMNASAADQATVAYQEALKLKPDLASAHYGLGSSLEARKQHDEAIKSLLRAIELGLNDANVHAKLGFCYNEKFDYDRAVLHLNQAAMLDEKNSSTFNNLGLACWQKGEYDQAIKSLLKAIDINPNNAIAHDNLGSVYQARGEYVQAIKHLGLAAKLRPKNSFALAELASALEEAGEIRESLSKLQQTLVLETPPTFVQRKKELERLEAVAKADAVLTDIVAGKTKPQGFQETMRFGNLCRVKKHYTAAIRFCEEALANAPDLAAKLDRIYFVTFGRAAALAAAGEGHEPPPEKERATYREKALGWLRQYLRLCQNELEKDFPRNRYSVQENVRLLLQHVDLASLRPPALDQLSGAERTAWQSFWSDVARLLERADAPLNDAVEKRPPAAK